MKKIALLFLLSVGIIFEAAAQAGVNTTNPTATLEIKAKNETGTATTVDGLLIPRVDRQRAQSMTNVPVSTLIYITSIANGTASASTINVDAVGYYYSNGTIWLKLSPAAVAANSNWATLGNTGTNATTNFIGTTDNIDFVTRTNNTEKMRLTAAGLLGIGTAAPLTTTHIVNTGTGGTGVFTANTANMALRLENTGNGQSVIQHLLTKNATGAAAQMLIGINPTYSDNGNNGLFLMSRSGANDFTMDMATGNFALGTAPNTTQKLAVGGNFSTTGTAGIGTNTPQRTLHINGSAQLTGELNVGGTATAAGSAGTAGQILTSAGAGAAPIWTTPASVAANSNWATLGNTGTNPSNNFIGTTDNTGFAVRTNNTERVRVDQAGNLGIGTTTPTSMLNLNNGRMIIAAGSNPANPLSSGYHDIAANAGTGEGTILRLVNTSTSAPGNTAILGFNAYNASGATWGVGVYQNDATANNSDYNVFYSGGGAYARRLTIKPSGNVGIGTTTPAEKLTVSGNIAASGIVTANGVTLTSDIRLKKDIVDNAYGLKEILNLRTINYRFKDEARGKDKKIGFIAQDIKAAMPELVHTANDEMKTLSVSYPEMTVVLTKAVQELQEMLKKQQAALEKMTAKSEQLSAELKTLKQQLIPHKSVAK